MKTRIFWWLLAGLVALRLILMASVPVFEPSEARYAAISANMARTGDFVVPRFTHNFEYQSFDGKPPLVFQAGGVFCKVFGVCEFAVRLFPFLSAALLLAILYYSVKRKSDDDAARLAVIVAATSTAFYAASGVAMTDMTLACAVAGSLLLYRSYLETRRLRYAAGIALLLGAGMITKGPIAIVLFGLPVFVDACVNRNWRAVFTWHWLAVLPLFLLVAVPWFILIERVNPGAGWYFFYNENFMRFISHEYGDKYGAGREAFRGVSILWALVVTLPWALVPIYKQARTATAPQWRTLTSFLPLAILAIVGFWCLTSRVLLYYLFPVIPLFAAALVEMSDRKLLSRLALPVSGLTACILSLALIIGTFTSEKMAGKKIELSPLDNHYAYEFYHGTPSKEVLAPYREMWLLRERMREERKEEEGTK